jgi:hypothetical protein
MIDAQHAWLTKANPGEAEGRSTIYKSVTLVSAHQLRLADDMSLDRV